MEKEKKRPSLEDLQLMDESGLQLEVAQIATDWPKGYGLPDWLVDSRIFDDLTPEKVVALREKAKACNPALQPVAGQ